MRFLCRPTWCSPLLTLILLAVTLGQAHAAIRISADSSSIDFGSLTLTSKKDVTVKVLNTSSTDVEIDNIHVVGLAASDFSIVSPSGFPIVVSSGTTIPTLVIVRFAPKLLGLRTASLEIETSDGILSIPIRGTGEGEQSDVDLSLSAIDFGTWAPESSRDTVIYIRSNGPDSATITGIEVSNSSSSLAFSAAFIDPTLEVPFRIGPGDSVGLTIHFDATVPEEQKDGQLLIYSNAATPPSASLTGIVAYGHLAFVPALVDFGSLLPGDYRDTIIRLVNESEVTVTVDDIQPLVNDFTILAGPTVPVILRAHESVDFTVRASPLSVGDKYSQLQIVSRSAQPNFNFAELKLNGGTAPLARIPRTPTEYYCAIPQPVTFSVSVLDTGSLNFQISRIVADDPSIVLMPVTSFPLTTTPGVPATASFRVDPLQIAGGKVAISVYAGNQVVLRDTLFFTPLSMTLSTAATNVIVTDTSNSTLTLGVSEDISRFAISELRFHVVPADLNVATISSSGATLAAGISATVTVQQDATGWIVDLTNMSGLPVGPISDLVTLQATRFVSKNAITAAIVSLTSPENAGCLDFTDAATDLRGLGGCASDEIRAFLNERSLLPRIDVRFEREQDEVVLDLSATSEVAGVLVISDAIGRTERSLPVTCPAGSSTTRISTHGMASGHHYVRFESTTGVASSRFSIAR